MAIDQEAEDWLASRFERVGRGYVIDVGPMDLGHHSHQLLERGWSGILVEPLPLFYRKLEVRWRNRRDVMTVNAAASSSDGEAWLYPFDSVTTLETTWKEACERQWDHVRYGSRIRMRTVTLKTLLQEAHAPQRINFLKVDAEGHDLSVLLGMDWDREVDVVMTETLDVVSFERKKGLLWEPKEEVSALMESQGLRLMLLTEGANAIFARDPW